MTDSIYSYQNTITINSRVMMVIQPFQEPSKQKVERWTSGSFQGSLDRVVDGLDSIVRPHISEHVVGSVAPDPSLKRDYIKISI